MNCGDTQMCEVYMIQNTIIFLNEIDMNCEVCLIRNIIIFLNELDMNCYDN
jgi:hypothetical protein